MSDNGLTGYSGLHEHYSEEEVKYYAALMRAARALVNISEAYHTSQDGSLAEHKAQKMFQEMLTKLAEKPEKMQDMIQGLSALVVHMKLGGTYEGWFDGLD